MKRKRNLSRLWLFFVYLFLFFAPGISCAWPQESPKLTPQEQSLLKLEELIAQALSEYEISSAELLALNQSLMQAKELSQTLYKQLDALQLALSEANSYSKQCEQSLASLEKSLAQERKARALELFAWRLACGLCAGGLLVSLLLP